MADIRHLTLAPQAFVGIRRQVPFGGLGAFFAEVLPAVHAWARATGLEPASPPAAIWCAMDTASGTADCHAGCFTAAPVQGEGEVTATTTPGGEALRLVHTGPYDTVGASWRALYAQAAALGRRPGIGWEVYLDDPGTVAADDLRTELTLSLA